MSEMNERFPHVVFNYDPSTEEHLVRELEICLKAIYLEVPESVGDDVNRLVRTRIAQLTQANAALEARIAEARERCAKLEMACIVALDTLSDEYHAEDTPTGQIIRAALSASPVEKEGE